MHVHRLRSFEFRKRRSDQIPETKFLSTKRDPKEISETSSRSSYMDEEMSGFCIKVGGRGASTGGTNGGGTKCGRWNPTAEQVKVLTDLFRSGLRTPTTEQIQKISYQLSFYGKIESKNVFYWFQNHKARERQKRRRISVLDQTLAVEPVEKSLPASKHLDQVRDSGRAVETLQLFPLDSYQATQHEKMRVTRNECQPMMFSCAIGRDFDHQPLDLRLSFL